MGFFDDDNDPFEEIVREFFGGAPSKISQQEFTRGEYEDRTIDFIETDKKIILVFEISGYNKEDINVTVKKDKIEIIARKNNLENIQGYLSQKLRQGVHIKKIIPKKIHDKKFSYTCKNGILEIIFDKK